MAAGRVTENSHGQTEYALRRERVLVLLDGSRLSYAALEAGAEIAAKKGVDILGIFVEDVNLLRSAGYGFAREVGAASGISRPFDRAGLEQRIQQVRHQVRQALAKAMAQRGGRHELSVARGQVVAEVLALAGPDDLLVLGRAGWSSAPGARLGSTARGLIRQSSGRLLLWCEHRSLPSGRVVVVLNDHGDANQRAIIAAEEVARHCHQPVTILLCQGAGVSQGDLDNMKQKLDVLGTGTRLRVLPANEPATIAQVLRQEGASQLVVSRECALFRDAGSEHWLVPLEVPVTVTP